MTEEIKAAGEVAKTTGKAIDASREFGGFISRFIEGSLEQGVGIFEDKLKYYRWKNQLSLMDKVNKELTTRGLKGPTRPVPLKIAIPLLQSASMEDDDGLQDLWANLLVNAADKDCEIEVRRTFINILQELTPIDALILKGLYSDENKDHISLDVVALVKGGRITDEEPDDNLSVSVENLCRLNLVAAFQYSGNNVITGIRSSKLGEYFHQACTAK